MEDEQLYVIKTFEQVFSGKKNKNIVLYGVGKNTQAILENVEGFCFIGLMDPNLEGQTIYGKPVFSIDDIIGFDKENLIIIIIARDSVVSIIYKRIEGLAIRNGIEIYNYKGKKLGDLCENDESFDIPYWSLTYNDLCKEIDNHEVISFDVFDTLLMRRVLIPTDVFELVEYNLKSEGINIPFRDLRIRAEENLKHIYPNLDDIYREIRILLKEYELDVDEAKLHKIRRIETETDSSLIISRNVMVNALEYAINRGKIVYLFTDMYYSSDHIDKLLNKNGINGYRHIYVSNEIKCSKEEGYGYEKFIELIRDDVKDEKKVLHIGDNRRADYDMAIRYGFDAYLVYSGYEMLMASSIKRLLINDLGLDKHVILGLLVSKLFNNPFALSETKGYVNIKDIRLLGYAFIAPMMIEFVCWMIRVLSENKIRKVLFPSRDGYLIKKIYDILTYTPVENFYFRASRRAVTVASIASMEDVVRIAERRFNGTIREFLIERYGINPGNDKNLEFNMSQMNTNDIYAYLKEFEELIIENAKWERNNYLGYLENKGILPVDNDSVAVFDFVSSGTIQYHLSKLLGIMLKGIYFATMNLPNNMYADDSADIIAAYGNIRSYGNTSALSQHYLVLESILTDKRDTLRYIDDNLMEVYENDGINNSFTEISIIQEGILEYCQEYKRIFGDRIMIRDFELKYADMIFGLLFDGGVIISNDVKNLFRNDDVYDGRGFSNVWN